MKAWVFVCSMWFVAAPVVAHNLPMRVESPQVHPPRATVRPVIHTYYRTKLADPYRYMEDLNDPDVQSWMRAQNDYTRAVLARLPGREQLLTRIVQLDQSGPDVRSVYRSPDDVYLYTKLQPGNDVYKLYIRQGLSGRERLLLDPEKVAIPRVLRTKGKSTIGSFVPSNDLKYVAVTIIPGGSENDTEIHVFETASGRELADVIPRCCIKSNPAWLPDNHSFVYGRLQKLASSAPAVEVRRKYRTYLHSLGTDFAKDRPVFGYGIVPSITVNPGHYALIRIQPNAKYAVGEIGLPVVSPSSDFYVARVATIGSTHPAWRKIAGFEDDVTDAAIHDNDLYLLTFKNAPRYKIVRVDLRNPDLSGAETVVPSSNAVIEDMVPAQDGLYVRLLDGGLGRILRLPYGPGARASEIKLPFAGAVFRLRALLPQDAVYTSDPRRPGILFLLNSWTKAYKIYAYDPLTRTVSDTHLQPSGPNDDFSGVVAEEVKVRSHDGILVPLSIVHPRNIKLDASNPTILYGYGAYGVSLNPDFDFTELAWFERGGIKATCHVRGGGEYGEEWHQAGKIKTKPNSWLDFLACAGYLIEKKYTSSARLGAEGASMGGLLVERAMTIEPNVFAAVLAEVGASDMVRAQSTDETGSPEVGTIKTREGFQALYSMSAYYHVKDGVPYPAVLLTTGINDAHLRPWQATKMAARLQAATSSHKPVLLYIDYAGGHGLGNTASKYDEQLADSWSFLLWQFGTPEFQP